MDFGAPYCGDFFVPSTPTREYMTQFKATIFIKYTVKVPPTVMKTQTDFEMKKCPFSVFFRTPPGSRACDFTNREILSKMVLDAYSQLFRTHSGFAVEN